MQKSPETEIGRRGQYLLGTGDWTTSLTGQPLTFQDLSTRSQGQRHLDC